MKTARVNLRVSAEPPYKGSTSIINSFMNDSLRDLGFDLSCSYGAPPKAMDIGDVIPLPFVSQVMALHADPVFDLELRCEGSLGLFPLLRRGTQKNVVLFHSLAGHPGLWLGNQAIDGYWGNSPYVTEVLMSLLATPHWEQGRLLDPRAFSVASTVTLPLPFLELPDGVLVDSEEPLPRAALEALEGNDILGCCVTEKLDERATFGILLGLNHLALRSALNRRFRLFVERYLYNRVKALLGPGASEEARLQFQPLVAALQQLDLTIDDILIPVPRLPQASLFKIVRACKFALLYHWLPEPFGLFPLEAVSQGCPVYTNGAGNLRHLLPDGHGISIVETEGMVFGDPMEYQKVAQLIYRNAVLDPEPEREACRRGADYISRTYHREAMKRDVEALVGKLEEPPVEAGLDDTTVRLSPLVRSWNPATRRVISDYKSCELEAAEAALLQEVLGERCADLEPRKTAAGRKALDRLFQQGLLTLSGPSQPI